MFTLYVIVDSAKPGRDAAILSYLRISSEVEVDIGNTGIAVSIRIKFVSLVLVVNVA